MQEAIVLGCNPKNSRSGTEALLYVWEDEQIKTCTIQKRHIFCTRRMTEDDANSRTIILARQFKDRQDIEIRKVKANKSEYVLQVKGPREISSLLPDYFLKNNHVSDLLDWTFPSFSKIIIENGKILGDTKPAKLEELLQLPILAIDLELDKAGTNKYIRINTAATASKEAAGAMCIFDGCTQEKLIEHLAKYIQNQNVPILCSHNIAFDLLKPKDIVGDFEIGVDCSNPVIKGGVGIKTTRDEYANVIERKGFPKIEVAGRQLFCSMSFARNHLWSPNNKLETVAEFLGIPYKKSLDYDSLEELVQKAEKGDVDAKEKIKAYCAEDAQMHLKLAERLLPVALTEALAFETDLISACFTSKSALATKLRDKRYFQALHTYRGERLELREFDIYEEKLDLLDKQCEIKPERGYFTEPLIVVFPTFLEQAFGSILDKEPAARKFKEAIKNSDSVIDKVIFHRDLEALCEEPLYDLFEYLKTFDAKAKGRFYGRYGGIDPNVINKTIASKLSDFAKLLDAAKVEIVNYTNRFLILKPKNSLEFAKRTLCDSSLVEFYGLTDSVISGEGGRVLASINKVAITSDLDIYGRRGLRTDFEREIYSHLTDFVTGKLAKADLFTILKGKFRDLAQGKVPKEDLIYYTTAGLEPWEYSWPAQKHEHVKVLKALGARKGDKVVFGYGIHNNISKRYKIDDFLSDDIKVDLDQYCDNFFGTKSEHGRSFAKGTISDMIYSLCLAKKAYEKDELTEFFEGVGELNHWNVYDKQTQVKLF